MSDGAKINQAEEVAKRNEEEARKWANRPLNNSNTIARLRKEAARARKRNS